MAGEWVVTDGGYFGLAEGGEGQILTDSPEECGCCCRTVSLCVGPGYSDQGLRRSSFVKLSGKLVAQARADDIAIVSPAPPIVLRPFEIVVDGGFAIAVNSGWGATRTGLSATVGGKRWSVPAVTPEREVSPAEFNAGYAAAGIRVVYPGDVLSLEELKAMGFKDGLWHLSVVQIGSGFGCIVMECI